MAKFKVTVSSLVTETYEIEADNADHAEELCWEGAEPTNTEWNDAQVLDVTLIEEKKERVLLCCKHPGWIACDCECHAEEKSEVQPCQR